MIGIYMSGTGNTRYCMEYLFRELGVSDEQNIPVETENIRERLIREDEIYLAYPTQFSNVPYFVKDFIISNSDLWNGKRVFCITTMGAFSGDGAGCAARLLKKYGATILGGLHIRMPDAVCDNKMLKKSVEENRCIVEAARKKIQKTAEMIKSGEYPQDGLSFVSHLAGLFGQRLWFYSKTSGYRRGPKISTDCVGCGSCEKLCPVGNISIIDGKAVSHDKCAMCYRCISSCPKQAITQLGKEVVEQCKVEKYI